MPGAYADVLTCLKNLSIKRKLTLITLGTSSLALVLSSLSFLIYDLVSFRHLLSQDLETQAEIIGNNSAAAMAFKDKVAATATLWALKAKEDVVSAALYTTDGHMFAYYVRAKADVPPPALAAAPQDRGFRFAAGKLEVSRKVTLNGDNVGVLFLQSDMRQWDARVRRYVSILFLFVLASGFFAWLVSSKLQILIAGPILHLEGTMRMVSASKNYEIRAVKIYNDEIGKLIDGFNTMLSELEQEINQHKNTQEELLKAKQAAEDASRAKSGFLANMSHELRTPLNAIIGYSEMLEEESKELEHTQFANDLQRIQGAGKHLLSLINDVLDLSKIEAGKMTLQLENFNVSRLIEEMVSTFKPSVDKNSNKLDVHVSGQVGTMRADITKVRQILFNLLSNACKFTERGTITLQADRITVDSEECMRFRVMDTGIGITPEQRSKLFKEFAQADSSISRKYGGSGLGLALCDRFVKMMKGRIDVESRPGRGSSFTVLIPVEVRLEAADPALTSKSQSDGTTAAAGTQSNPDTVLVIDDDPVGRDLMTRLLTKLDFNPVPASSGAEGIRLAKQLNPAIIMLDVIMPGMDGWAVLNQLKSDPQLARIPVIMATIVDNETMGIDLGASVHLTKPVDRELLADILSKYRTARPFLAGRNDEPPVDGQHSSGAEELQETATLHGGSITRGPEKI